MRQALLTGVDGYMRLELVHTVLTGGRLCGGHRCYHEAHLWRPSRGRGWPRAALQGARYGHRDCHGHGRGRRTNGQCDVGHSQPQQPLGPYSTQPGHATGAMWAQASYAGVRFYVGTG